MRVLVYESFLEAFSGKSAVDEQSLLVLLLVIWAADFSWVLTCADIWLRAPSTLSWCFSLSLWSSLRGNVLWTSASALALADVQTRQANLRVLTLFPEMSGQVEKLSCCVRCWLMCVWVLTVLPPVQQNTHLWQVSLSYSDTQIMWLEIYFFPPAYLNQS